VVNVIRAAVLWTQETRSFETLELFEDGQLSLFMFSSQQGNYIPQVLELMCFPFSFILV
jgi:hypothetical protein